MVLGFLKRLFKKQEAPKPTRARTWVDLSGPTFDTNRIHGQTITPDIAELSMMEIPEEEIIRREKENIVRNMLNLAEPYIVWRIIKTIDNRWLISGDLTVVKPKTKK